MDDSSPTAPAERSRAPAGVIASEPTNPTSVAVRDEHDQPMGILEDWGGGTWIYADVASLEPLEPATNDSPH